MILTESALSKLGSRFTINFKPHESRVLVSALGKFLDVAADLAIGIVTPDGREAFLPFTKLHEHIGFVEQELTMTSITFRGRSAELGLMLEAIFTSPFYPQDEKISTAPVFYVTIRVSPIRDRVLWEGVPRDAARTGTVVLEVLRPGCAVEEHRGLRYHYQAPREAIRGQGDRTFTGDPSRDEAAGIPCMERIVPLTAGVKARGTALVAGFDASAEAQEWHFVWAAHTADKAVMNAAGVDRAFKYTEFFADVDEVVAYARDHMDIIARKTALFDSLTQGSTLTKSAQDFMAYAFQSYLLNTFWMRSAEGDDWFSVWEGICLFNSTVDVEYNLALFYLAFWPELLELTFDEWVNHVQPGGYLSHDMGAGLVANSQSYPHPMECEENTNFLLMLHAHWRWTGHDAPVHRHFETVRTLAQYLIAADTTGNGFPNEGIANTIDDASPAVQYSREQTYLAVKTLAALECAAEIGTHLEHADFAAECTKQAAKIRKTLDKQAWLDDHYAVCIDKVARGLKDVWTGEELPEHELEGWDAFSLYTTNGLLYPMLVGKEVGVDMERMAEDVANSLPMSMLEYGCTHSSADRSNIWVSQNLWRDFTAAYMGIDCLDMLDRYWAFQVFANARPDGKCFIDTYLANNLCYYPRGITACGVFMAAVGFTMDRVAERITMHPLRLPCRMPLVACANWEEERVPWVEFRYEDDELVREIDDYGLLDDMLED